MAHRQMFDDDDPYLGRVREIAGAFPAAEEKISHGRVAFYTKKVFAYYGTSVKVAGQWIQHPQAIVFLPDPDDIEAIEADDRIFVPGYLGPSGWFALDLDASTDWDEIRELLDASYRVSASKRLVAELDAAD